MGTPEHYRVYYHDLYPDDTVVVCAVSPQAAIRHVAGRRGDCVPGDVDGWVAEVYRPEMESACVCGQGRRFRNLAHPGYPGLWQCRHCGCAFALPPDQVNWCWEAMFDAGYVPCPCDGYGGDCVCGGLGWVKADEEYEPVLERSSDLWS
jgi:hypothetical protein